MNCIGIRVEPRAVTFAIYSAKVKRIINVEKLVIPQAMRIPEQLSFIRSNILDVFREFGISHVGIRITESNARQMNVSRIQLEGVIQEAIASSPVDTYYTGQISSISARLGFKRTDFKKYLDNELIFDIEGWTTLDKVEKEAVLTAVGAAL